MSKKINKFSFTFSPKALLSVVPTVVSNEIQEFLFSLGSLVSLHLVLGTGIYYSLKQENYINFRVLLTRVKLFNSLTCKTIYSELLKELIKYYSSILSLYKLNTLIMLGELLNVFTTFR